MSEGKLVVCATPIGNLGDISDRLRETLRAADIVYAEDTRRTATLLRHIGVSTELRSLFTGNELSRTEELIEGVRSGLTVALVSDAGMPTVSDPGAEAVRRAQAEDLTVTVIPGPSAVTTAVTLAGFGGDRFVFEGFLPKKGLERATRLAGIAAEEKPTVVFASPHRVAADLADLLEAAGSERRVAVTRELTKLHEEVWVGTLAESVRRWAGEGRGEFTLVVEGRAPPPPDATGAIARARALVAGGSSNSAAARTASAEFGVSRRLIYQALLGNHDAS